MDFFKAISFKFIMVTALMWVFLSYFGFSFGDVIITSILFTGISFIVGDLFILPRMGNGAATIADFGVAAVLIWSLGFYLFEPFAGLVTVAIVTAIIVAFAEAFFHRYMQNQVLPTPVLRNQKVPDYYEKKVMAAEFGKIFDFETSREIVEGKNREEKKLKEEKERVKEDYYNG
ncbi:DUF2512 family protein [Sporosarcina sp. G11-34]|uniref:DUF2512 family protein n=1 Tax=Sporosarcina sp. G11-34 TaxID=2849605 RepID=UPI0022A8E94F|nr:DUF2512 family protein [Sporosarcina sp. G11-34]MCZ2259135.1 YndM family protein [Sporosarcina sp. G11-34]